MANRKNEYKIFKNKYNKDKIIYREKCHNKKIIQNGKYKKEPEYYVLTQKGFIYIVKNDIFSIKNKKSKKRIYYFNCPVYYGNIRREHTFNEIRVLKFIKNAKKYIQQKGIKLR